MALTKVEKGLNFDEHLGHASHNGATFQAGRNMKKLYRRLAKIIIGIVLICTVFCTSFFLFIAFSGERSQTVTVNIENVTNKSSITLATPSKGVSGLTIHVTGEINGQAYVFASNWEKKELSGKVDWRIYHDWFEPTCVLQYEPVSVTSGNLRIDYTFYISPFMKDR